MQIAHIEGATRVVGKSQGYFGLPLRDEVMNCAVNGPDTPAMITAWEPTAEEIAALLSGAKVYLRVLGTVHPPVMLWVGEKP